MGGHEEKDTKSAWGRHHNREGRNATVAKVRGGRQNKTKTPKNKKKKKKNKKKYYLFARKKKQVGIKKISLRGRGKHLGR